MFQVPLKQFINESHELVGLSKKIDWESLEKDLSVYYCEDNGRPGVPIRLIVGIIMLRRMLTRAMKAYWTVGLKTHTGPDLSGRGMFISA